MILYNTLMGVSAGLALLLVPLFGRKLYRRQSVAAEGWAISFGVLGIILAVLGALMATTWPLKVNPPINIIFGEPCMFLGLLLIGAATFVWSRRTVFAEIGASNRKVSDDAYVYIIKVLQPISWVLFGLGLILLASSLAIFRFGFVGAAPATEPISGLLHNHPMIENTFFGILYALPALALLLMPFAVRKTGVGIAKLALTLLFITGIALLLFGAMNYYTHIGLQVNTLQHKNYRY
jgi:hypothetical protein